MSNPIFPTTEKAAEKNGTTHSSSANRNARFPTRLRTLRKEKGVSQAVLAQKLGISKSTLGLWETGETLPDAKSLYDLADYFGVSTDYILCRTETPSMDLGIRYVCDYTGIPEETIKALVSQHKNLDSSYMEAFNDFFTPICMQEVLAHLWYVWRSANSLKTEIASVDDVINGKDEYPVYDDHHDNVLVKSHGIRSSIRELRLERFEAVEYLSRALDSAYKIPEIIEKAKKAGDAYSEYLDNHSD